MPWLFPVCEKFTKWFICQIRIDIIPYISNLKCQMVKFGFYFVWCLRSNLALLSYYHAGTSWWDSFKKNDVHPLKPLLITIKYSAADKFLSIALQSTISSIANFLHSIERPVILQSWHLSLCCRYTQPPVDLYEWFYIQ